MRLNNKQRASIRGLMMGCFGINLFMLLLVMEAWGAGLVPDHLPVLIIVSAGLCLYGYVANKDLPEEEDDGN